VKVHWYFKQRVLDNPKRSRVTVEFCERVVAAPEYSEVQNDGRVCYWGHVPEIGYHIRVIVLEDGETLFNAFEDRNFTRRQRRRT
jgi:hypothetical protein